MITYLVNDNRARSLADHLTCCKCTFVVHYENGSWTFVSAELSAEQDKVAWQICGEPTLIAPNKVPL